MLIFRYVVMESDLSAASPKASPTQEVDPSFNKGTEKRTACQTRARQGQSQAGLASSARPCFPLIRDLRKAWLAHIVTAVLAAAAGGMGKLEPEEGQ